MIEKLYCNTAIISTLGAKLPAFLGGVAAKRSFYYLKLATAPSAPLRMLRAVLLMSQPPRLRKAGSKTTQPCNAEVFFISMHQDLNSPESGTPQSLAGVIDELAH